MNSIDQIDEIVEPEAAVAQRHVARIDPVGQIDVVVGQRGRDGAAQQGREMPRQRRDDQQLRLVERAPPCGNAAAGRTDGRRRPLR